MGAIFEAQEELEELKEALESEVEESVEGN